MKIVWLSSFKEKDIFIKRHRCLSQRGMRITTERIRGDEHVNSDYHRPPEDTFPSLRSSPEDLVKEMQLAAVAKCYGIGLGSQSKAAELAGVSRERFLEIFS